MGRLVDGKWITSTGKPNKGAYQRKETKFRDWISPDGSTGRAPERDRYHLYVSLACPWAHRVVITRSLKQLEDVVSMSIVGHLMGEDGWEFSDEPGAVADPIHNARYLREIYVAARSDYTGRVSTPVLWDKRDATIVNNESVELMRMLDRAFGPVLGDDSVVLFPDNLDGEIDAMIAANYHTINNGVYRCGFAGSQQAYDEAVTELFDRLDAVEAILSGQRYLVGDGKRLTAADICLFTTLYRFDAVYNCHFSCNRNRIIDYPNLWAFTRDVYQQPGVADTCNMDHIRKHYYRSHESIRPRRIVAIGPALDFDEPHRREAL